MAKRKKPRSLRFNKKVSDNIPDKKSKGALFVTAGNGRDGCSAFRMEWPRVALNTSGLANIETNSFPHPLQLRGDGGQMIVNPIYTNNDTVVVQRPVTPERIDLFNSYNFIRQQIKNSGKSPFRIVVDVDDICHGDHVTKFNNNGQHYFDNERFKVFSECVKKSDELHVCSKAMADFYKEEIGVDYVTHKPNLLPKYLYDWYDIERSERVYEMNKNKPRILYAGAAQHFDMLNQNGGKDDFTHILELIQKTKKKWKWVFFGAHPQQLTDDIKNGTIEFHPYIPITSYPKKLIELNADVMLAPLENNVFNNCKSNIKLTEAGALGIAGVFQDMAPYKDAPMKFSTADEMADHIESLMDWGVRKDVIEKQRKFSEGFFMENNLDMLMATYFTPINSLIRNKVCPKLETIQ